ncbi:hypothetical protein FOTG_10984 [Fusarium oxysporum f. sp. vasinfectum 25433]|uniref:Uncharacterized protein n=1 Tax=Fusarium oxysporum f. sp. vasinfectum 25433 TaxID=1089449 RepID=X0LJE1_FUSOX|nr:hypothetical protein FOTG_10984 [Fusarium oxysporum f. sp. vasinfectum 25433]
MSTVLVRVSVVTCQREFDICHNFMIPHNGAGVLEYERVTEYWSLELELNSWS